MFTKSFYIRRIGVIALLLLVSACDVLGVVSTHDPDDELATASSLIRTATARAMQTTVPTSVTRVTFTPVLVRTTTSTRTVTGTEIWTRIPTLMRTPISTPTITRTPGGPATKVIASLPSSIPCKSYLAGCQWSYIVTFTETKGIMATIKRLGVRYVDTHGSGWAVWGHEWFDHTLEIPPFSSRTYSN